MDVWKTWAFWWRVGMCWTLGAVVAELAPIHGDVRYIISTILGASGALVGMWWGFEHDLRIR